MKRTKHQYIARHQDLSKTGMLLSIQIFFLDWNLPSEFFLCVNKDTDNIMHFYIVPALKIFSNLFYISPYNNGIRTLHSSMRDIEQVQNHNATLHVLVS